MIRALSVALALGLAATPVAAAENGWAKFIDRDGKSIGTAALSETTHGVLIALDLEGLPPGEHAFHIHERGTCDPKDGFASAGGHYNPADKAHGYFSDGGPHAGDMENQFVGKDGRLKAHVMNERVKLGAGGPSLTDQDGSALMFHAKPDDYRSQPAGAAGDRIACAVVQVSRE